MKTVIQLIIVIAVVGGTGFPAHGRVQPQMLCWSPDVEFPVLCEEEESDEYGHRALPVAWPARHCLVPDAIASFVENQR